MSRPPSLHRLGKVRWERRCWWYVGEHAPLHNISDPAKIEASVVTRDPRVRDALCARQFDYGRHGGRHFAVVHNIALYAFDRLRD